MSICYYRYEVCLINKGNLLPEKIPIIRGSVIKFPEFLFVWALLLIVHT